MENEAWTPPSQEKRQEALIGCNNILKKSYKTSFSLRQRQFFESDFFYPITVEADADWLVNNETPGQAFESFWRANILGAQISVSVSHKRHMRPQTTASTRTTAKSVPQPIKPKIICIQPVGPLPESDTEVTVFLIWLKSYCSAFFQKAKVVILSPLSVEEIKCEFRVNQLTGKFQLKASNILNHLKKVKPKYAYCVIALTMIDLYPKSAWDFTFGLSSSNDGVGIFSLTRCDDIFYETWTQGKDAVNINEDGSLDYSVFSEPLLRLDGSPFRVSSILLLRTCKLVSHEICQMFGLKHCIWSACVMNGTNHIQESDRRPPFLCPVCIRKLQTSLGFDLLERYRAMQSWSTDQFWKHFVFVEDKPVLSPTKASKPMPIRPRRASMPNISQTGDLSRKTTTKRTVSSKPNLDLALARPLVEKLLETSNKKIAVDQPPLDSFESFQIWLRDVIDFLSVNS